jgi:hypothetical protein
VPADLRVACLDGMFSHALKVEIRWTANPLRVGKRFGKIDRQLLVAENCCRFFEVRCWHCVKQERDTAPAG